MPLLSRSAIRTCTPSVVAAWLVVAAMPAAARDQAPVEPESPPAPAPEAAPAKPAVERLDATRYRVGGVTLDQKTREIRFPAVVNMTEGLLEYALVRSHGKLHESLLATDVPATDIQLAFALLRYPPSAELYPLLNDKGGVSNRFPVVPEATKAAARIQVNVEWDDAGKSRTAPLNEWIQHATKGSAMPATLWVYGGSLVEEGNFYAESTGDLIAIFLSGAALVNYPGKDNDDDTVWLPYPKRVPAIGTKITVVIAPNPELKKTTAPTPAKTAVPPAVPATSTSTHQPS
jgi:hypothetical protein